MPAASQNRVAGELFFGGRQSEKPFRVSFATIGGVCPTEVCTLVVQMGGIEGVEATESWAATLHARHGLFMHAVPR